jgi:hypothetical protein
MFSFEPEGPARDPLRRRTRRNMGDSESSMPLAQSLQPFDLLSEFAVLVRV